MPDTQSIAALLEALKSHEPTLAGGKPPGGGADAISNDKPSHLGADSSPIDPDALGAADPDADSEGSEDPAMNAAIVDALQDKYPSIYAELSDQVAGGGDDLDGDADADAAPMVAAPPARSPAG